MKIFVAGTDTDAGKTLIASWLCLHTNFPYYKPLQTGSLESRDADVVTRLAGVKIYPESYCFPSACAPERAARLAGEIIDFEKIYLPKEDDLIIEGAGGLLVPINADVLLVDWVKQRKLSVILVANCRLGAINHTLLSLEALRHRQIPILGVILNGGPDLWGNAEAIHHYGKVPILDHFPFLDKVSSENLLKIIPSPILLKLLKSNEPFHT
jgi:dethiobiotin synthetase